MGITGLLPFLKKASRKSHIRQFSGQVVGVDGSCWLHKGAFGCAQKLGTGEHTIAYITYFTKFVNILRENGLRPILVFDGRSLPSKEVTNKKRREKREENKKKAKEALRAGNKREAWECFQKAVEITPAMVREVIKVLRQEKLDYIISPYESDAQLAFLANNGIVDLVITEDSDLVLFGCKKIFFKMNANGDGVVFDQSKLHLCMDQSSEKFQFEKFRQMCIFSGCDYLESIAGIGLGRAKKVFTLTKNHEIEKIIREAPNILKMEIEITNEYIAEFVRAENTFLYQLVFDPMNRALCPLTPYLKMVENMDLSYCGKLESARLSLDMALGNVDTRTLKQVDRFNIDDPGMGYATEKSMWSKRFRNISQTREPSFPRLPKEAHKTKRSPKKSMTISSRHIFEDSVEENSYFFIKDYDEEATNERHDEYHMLQPPKAKRARLQNFCNKDTPNNKKNVQNSSPRGVTEMSSATSSSDGTLIQLRNRKTYIASPFANKSKLPGRTVTTEKQSLGLLLSPTQEPNNVNGCSQQEIMNAKPMLTPPRSTTLRSFHSEEAIVMVEKLPLNGNSTVKICSRYFVEKRKEFLGGKNHPLYSREGKRTSL